VGVATFAMPGRRRVVHQPMRFLWPPTASPAPDADLCVGMAENAAEAL